MADTPTTPSTAGPDLKPYEDKIVAALHDAEARITSFEEKAKKERQQAEVAAIEQLKVARKKLEQQLKNLGTGSAAQIEHAKTDIDKAAAALKASLDEIGKKLAAADRAAVAKPAPEKAAAPEKK
jgi:multidrug resistance efflux pump